MIGTVYYVWFIPTLQLFLDFSINDISCEAGEIRELHKVMYGRLDPGSLVLHILHLVTEKRNKQSAIL